MEKRRENSKEEKTEAPFPPTARAMQGATAPTHVRKRPSVDPPLTLLVRRITTATTRPFVRPSPQTVGPLLRSYSGESFDGTWQAAQQVVLDRSLSSSCLLSSSTCGAAAPVFGADRQDGK
jgi:hypothetical protein